MEASVEQRDGVVTVHIAGSVDGTTADSLQQVFARELEAGHHQLIADFSAVDYTSSAGLRVLLGTVKATEAVLLHAPLADVAHWLKLLVAADVIYVVAGLLTFDFILEG